MEIILDIRKFSQRVENKKITFLFVFWDLSLKVKILAERICI